MRYVYGAVTLLIAIVAASFAVSNRAVIDLGLWPLPNRIDCPVYLLVLVALALGFVIGGCTAWLNGGRVRRERRRLARRIADLEDEARRRQADTGRIALSS
jgi:putative membrane protein